MYEENVRYFPSLDRSWPTMKSFCPRNKGQLSSQSAHLIRGHRITFQVYVVETKLGHGNTTTRRQNYVNRVILRFNPAKELMMENIKNNNLRKSSLGDGLTRTMRHDNAPPRPLKIRIGLAALKNLNDMRESQ